MLIPVLNAALLATVYSAVLLGVALIGLVAAWTRTRAIRLAGWPDLRLKYEETIEPAVDGLNLLR